MKWQVTGERPSRNGTEIRKCKICETEFNEFKSQPRKYCSIKCGKIGKSKSISLRNLGEFREKNLIVLAKNRMIPYWAGKKRPLETSMKQSLSMLGLNKAENNGNWKGGHGNLRRKIAFSTNYKWWRHSIFVRDKYICCECHKVGGILHAHHIKSVKSIIKKYQIITMEEANRCRELWNINNGVTLCNKCHLLKHPNVAVLRNTPRHPYKNICPYPDKTRKEQDGTREPAITEK